jgi:peptidoglycan/xylan/chitin deacetylase (PgdA/CDA1 family)
MVNENLPPWPNEKKFALCLTHDVDRVDKKWWQCAYYFFKHRDPYQLKSLLTKKKERPFWNFERIMEIESKYGVRSTFFFLNETKKANLLKPSTYSLSFGYYKIDDPRIVGIIRALDSDGWEIGVHGSYDSYLNKDLLRKEKATLEGILGKPVLGIRQHYLNLSIPRTWELQAREGFRYDSSFGFRDKVGFRDDKLRPYRPLDDELLEIPMTIMDGPLFASSRNNEEAWEKCKRLIDQAQNQSALLTILWHNNRFNDKEFPGQTEIYEKIIKECQSRGAWVATGEEIYRWSIRR